MRVSEAYAADDHLSTPDAPDRPVGEITELRVAYSADLGWAPVEPAARRALGEALARMSDNGWRLEEDVPEGSGEAARLRDAIAVCEGYAPDRTLLAGAPDALEQDTRRLLEAGRDTGAAEYLDAMWDGSRYAHGWQAFFERRDLLITPAMQLTAFEHGRLAPAEIDGGEAA